MFVIETGIRLDAVLSGKAWLYAPSGEQFSYCPSGDPETEISRFHEAVAKVKSDLGAREAAADSSEVQAIFAAHLEMADDPMLAEEVEDKVRNAALPADKAVDAACSAVCEMILQLDDEYLRSRADDVRDVCRRIVKALAEETAADCDPLPSGSGTGCGSVPSGSGTGCGPLPSGSGTGCGSVPSGDGGQIILVAEELSPSDVADLPFDRLSGLITSKGSATSHVCIIARGKGVVAMPGAAGCEKSINNGDELIIDGPGARIIVNPDEATAQNYRQIEAGQKAARGEALKAAANPALTVAGDRVFVEGNAASVDDVRSAIAAGADGIGLFRTEFVYMESPGFPDEDTQYEIYRAAALLCGNRPLTLRTLDVGGDKPLPYLDIPKEDNPFLGWRAIRMSLDMREMFRTQLRAILRASVHGNVRVMFPMLTSVQELREAKAELSVCKNELALEGQAFNGNIPVGVMIETPAAVVIADSLAAECDFFSIGTNDLTQYVMAADRGNPKVLSLCDPLNEAVRRSIAHVIAEGKAAGIDVGMCGEMASDARATGFLLDSGLRKFSVASSKVAELKARIRKY